MTQSSTTQDEVAAYDFTGEDFIQEVIPRVFKVKVPLPDNPLKVINSYFLLGENTTTIVDVGFNHPACEAALDVALEKLGRSWDSVEVLLTHSHPDHTGNLDRIYRDGMHVYGHLHSFQEVQNLQDMEAKIFEPLIRQAARPQDEGLSFEKGVPRLKLHAELLPLKYRPDVIYIEEGDTFEAAGYTFSVIETPGHDKWHICLYEPTTKTMIIGDHVLEYITPAVSSWFTTYNALEEFMASLGKIYRYDVDLVLPAHGDTFTDLQSRVLYLKDHHQKRLEEIYGLVAEGYDNIVSISQHAKWKYADWCLWPLDQKYFSMAETMAHLIYLVCAGKIRQTICGDDYRFVMPTD